MTTEITPQEEEESVAVDEVKPEVAAQQEEVLMI